VIINDVRMQVDSVMLAFKTGSADAFVRDVHVYDGRWRIAEFNLIFLSGPALCASRIARGSGDLGRAGHLSGCRLWGREHGPYHGILLRRLRLRDPTASAPASVRRRRTFSCRSGCHAQTCFERVLAICALRDGVFP
jgi:hypothetical protein